MDLKGIANELRKKADEMDSLAVPVDFGADITLQEALTRLRLVHGDDYFTVDLEVGWHSHNEKPNAPRWQVYTQATSPSQRFEDCTLSGAVKKCLEHIGDPPARALEMAEEALSPTPL